MEEKTCPRCAETIKRAAVVCRFCGHEFGDSAQKSGALIRQSVNANATNGPDLRDNTQTDNRVIRNFGLGCLGILVLGTVIGAIGQGGGAPASNEALAPVVEDNVVALANGSPSTTTDTPPPTPVSNWTVSDRKDEIRGSSVYQATVTSSNEVNFDFPYAGGSTLDMTVRKHPQYGEDVIFQISDGQFNCGIDDCSGMISVDGKSETLSLVPPEDHDSKTLFAAYGSGIIKRLKGSKKVIVELPFYQEGNRQFTFETSGLVWPPKR